MKKAFTVVTIFCLLLQLGCSQDEQTQQKSDYTGNEITYSLISGSEFNISGIAVFKERTDNTTSIVIDLKGIY
jgi:hypothetical protein